MGLKRKQMLVGQKEYFEGRLQNRLSVLSERGVEAPKDTIARKFKANIKAIDNRIKFITDIEKKAEDMVKAKAEKAAGPVKEQEAAKVEKPKKGAAEGKEKKPKAEKKPGEGKPAKKEKPETPAT